MKRSGKVQMVYKATATTKEKNWVHPFAGVWQLARLIWRAYKGKNGPYKAYIFFD